jgi:hypothetical protein
MFRLVLKMNGLEKCTVFEKVYLVLLPIESKFITYWKIQRRPADLLHSGNYSHLHSLINCRVFYFPIACSVSSVA